MPLSPMLRAAPLALALLLGACTPRVVATDPAPTGADAAPVATGGVTLMARPTEVRRGERVDLTLFNGGASPLEGGVLACAATEHWAGGRWHAVDTGRACIMMAVTVAPGESIQAQVPMDVPAGTYRLAHSMTETATGSRVVATTAPVRVR